MSKERMVQVTKDEYKDLIRDQHTVELLTGYVQEQSWIIDSTICLLLGIQKSECELPPGWDPEPESETVTADIPLPVPAMEEAEEEKQSPPPQSPRRKRAERKKTVEKYWRCIGLAGRIRRSRTRWRAVRLRSQ